jgi:hypothetical protein
VAKTAATAFKYAVITNLEERFGVSASCFREMQVAFRPSDQEEYEGSTHENKG